MNISAASTHNAGDTNYTAVEIEVGKKSYYVMQAEGKFNYVSVNSKNSFAKRYGFAKEFSNFEEAYKAYGSKRMHQVLLAAKQALINYPRQSSC